MAASLPGRHRGLIAGLTRDLRDLLHPRPKPQKKAVPTEVEAAMSGLLPFIPCAWLCIFGWDVWEFVDTYAQ